MSGVATMVIVSEPYELTRFSNKSSSYMTATLVSEPYELTRFSNRV